MQTPRSSPPSIEVKHFEGPLDLLLDAVRRQHVAIENLALAPMAQRFLAYVRTATECQLNLDIEWIHMAATLIQWKSRSLLPADPAAPPPPDPIRDKLVAQLARHRQQAAADLDQRRSVELNRFAREPGGEFTEEREIEASAEPAFESVWDLVQQARELARWAREHREDRCNWDETFGVAKDFVTVTAMMTTWGMNSRRGAPDKTLDGTRLMEIQLTLTPSRQACLFLGMLEMARVQQLELVQNSTFGPIYLTLWGLWIDEAKRTVTVNSGEREELGMGSSYLCDVRRFKYLWMVSPAHGNYAFCLV